MKTWGPRLLLSTALLVWVLPALGMVYLGLHTAVSHSHDHVAVHGHDHGHDHGHSDGAHSDDAHSDNADSDVQAEHPHHVHGEQVHGEQVHDGHRHGAEGQCRVGHGHDGTFERLSEILSHGHSHDDATPEHEHPLRTDTPAPSSKLSLGLPIAVVGPDETWLAAGLSGRLEAPPARRLLKVPIFRLRCALLI